MEKSKKAKINIHAIRRIFTAVLCTFIGISVAVVMFNIYDPNQNSLGALSSVCMDIVCILILFILIGSFAFGDYVINRTTRVFSGLLLATIWAMFLDFLNWAFDGMLEFGKLTYWFTVGSLCMGSILACIFSMYLYSYMEETHSLSQMKISARVCAIMNLFSFVLTFVLAITGTAFQFVDGHYETGVLYDVVTVIPVLTLVFLTGVVIRFVKKVGLHDVFAVAGYIFFMIAGALIEAVYSIGTTYVAVAIADIFIFVMLQNEIVALEKRNVQKWMRRSYTDELTGLPNRYAYEADLKLIDEHNFDEDFVFVSVDVNSLKAVNDSMGHSVGDELLIGAAECMTKCFEAYGKVYRTGGDEFIALLHADRDHLINLKSEIKDVTKSWKGTLVDNLAISCGYATVKDVPNPSIKQLAMLADRRMYEDKEEYYRITGIERRKK